MEGNFKLLAPGDPCVITKSWTYDPQSKVEGGRAKGDAVEINDFRFTDSGESIVNVVMKDGAEHGPAEAKSNSHYIVLKGTVQFVLLNEKNEPTGEEVPLTEGQSIMFLAGTRLDYFACDALHRSVNLILFRHIV